MAQQVLIRLVDDTDGTEATETVTYALDGRSYEIDLNADNAQRLREDMLRWVECSRRIGAERGARKPARRDRAQSKAIRAWARENGHAASEKGIIPRAAVRAYEAAHRVAER